MDVGPAAIHSGLDARVRVNFNKLFVSIKEVVELALFTYSYNNSFFDSVILSFVRVVSHTRLSIILQLCILITSSSFQL